jgi:hypothetical protein
VARRDFDDPVRHHAPEWGEDGRIRPDATVHSPFVRRKQRLELE